MRKVSLSLHTFGKNARSFFNLKEAHATAKANENNSDAEIFLSVQKLWNTPIQDLSVAIDLPRLSRRVIVKDKEDNIIFPPANVASLQTLDCMCELMLSLTEVLEGYERREAIEEELRNIVKEKSSALDDSTSAKKMLNVIGTDEASPTIRALKTIHQGMVGLGIFEIKNGMEFVTKDVRTPDGWKILIHVKDDVVQISHIRREQTIDFEKTNHWEFTWELRMLFNKTISQLEQTLLGVVSLHLNEQMNPNLGKRIQEDVFRRKSDLRAET